MACDVVQLDLPLSEVFYKWMLGGELTLQPDDIRHICPVFAKSFMQLTDVLRQKKRIESDKSHVRCSSSSALHVPCCREMWAVNMWFCI